MTAARLAEQNSLVDQLVRHIHDSIVFGEMAPGAHISVREIANTYGVSMIPVREALARLGASRLLTSEKNRGYFVAEPPSKVEFQEFLEARALFETSVVRLGFENVDEEDLKMLRDLNAQMHDLFSGTDEQSIIIEWSALNVRFHQVLVGLARNFYLSEQYSDMSFGNTHLQLMRAYPHTPDNLKKLVNEHDELITALEAGEKERFLDMLSNHVTRVVV
ncbi:MAG: GntR family transcriptional regulator [Pseudomonadota bacterium]